MELTRNQRDEVVAEKDALEADFVLQRQELQEVCSQLVGQVQVMSCVGQMRQALHAETTEKNALEV